MTLTTWSGGGFDAIEEALPTGSSMWVAVGGELFGYVVGAPEFVNQPFVDLYPDGVPEGTPVLVVLLEE